MKTIDIEISQNGWEYSGSCEVISEVEFEIKRSGKTEITLIIEDGRTLVLNFDEEIKF